MSNWWKKTKEKRDEAQNLAARKLAQAARAAGVVSDSESDVDEIVSDEDEPDDAQADGELDDEPTIEAHRANLASVNVAQLRRLLRERGKSELATVRAADLPAGVPTAGPQRIEAVRCLLCSRLARVLADGDDERGAE